MNTIKYLIDLFLHIDKNLAIVIHNFGFWSYGLLFAVIFIETGVVIMPFLPGDSLIFAAGALAAIGSFKIVWLYLILLAAAFLGDTVNYWIGHFVGPKAFSNKAKVNFFGLKISLGKFLKDEYLEEAQKFYDKYGGKAIILARFVPIVRTFAPFVAGIGKMNYKKFIYFNFIGGFLWVTLFTMGGYFLGNLPFFKANFHYMVLLIIGFSLVPVLWEVVKHKMQKK
jgi:membrane-associated protein